MRMHHWFLIIAVLVIGYVLMRGGSDRYTQPQARLNYDTVAVSQGMTEQARALNLEKALDISLLPEIGKASIREAASKGLQKQEFLQAVMRDVSNRVSEISTIDLNKDGKTDPILIKPEPDQSEQFVILSIRVPAQNAYPLPSAGDAEAWRKVETFEVATLTVSLNQKELTVQARGNRHMYPNSYNRHYYAYDRGPSIMQTYMTMRMMEWMFFPRYYGGFGPGYGYGYYRPMGVGMRMSRRSAAIGSRGYGSSRYSSQSVVRGRSGRTPSSSYSRKSPPRSLSQLRSTRSFSRRQSGRIAGRGGFGRNGGGRYAPSGRYSSRRSSPRGFGGFGRGSSRGSFSGGGRRFGK
ncbi:MAG: hypothetical protein V3S64_14995 [bacterium]